MKPTLETIREFIVKRPFFRGHLVTEAEYDALKRREPGFKLSARRSAYLLAFMDGWKARV